MDGDTRVDVPEVLAMAQGVADVGTRIERQATALRGWAPEVAAAVGGAKTCAAMPGLATAYAELVRSMGVQVETFGTEMHRAAADYRSADVDARAAIGSAGRPAAEAARDVAKLVRR